MDIIYLMIKKREEMGWTKKFVAKKVKVSESSISNWENGKSFPSLKNQVKIIDCVLNENNEQWVKRLLKNRKDSSFESYKKQVEKLYSIIFPLVKKLNLTISYVDHLEVIQYGGKTEELEISDLLISDFKNKIHLRFNCLSCEEPGILFLSTSGEVIPLTTNESVFYLPDMSKGKWYVNGGNGEALEVKSNVFKVILGHVFFGC